jgi:phage antirepressor YoqD-like protein
MSNKVFSYDNNPITFQLGEATMVNATEMAKPFGKLVKDWLKNNQTKEFINTLSTVRNIFLTDLVKVKQGGTAQGTWLHEDVALEFARWLSPSFAIWCNDRIKELMRYGMTATPSTIDALLNDPDTMIQTLQALKSEREKVAQANRRIATLTDQRDCFHSENQRLQRLHTGYIKTIERQAPLVEYANNVLNSESTYTTTQIAKELGMSAQLLNRLLHAYGVQFKQSGQWQLYKQYEDKGYTKTRTHTYTKKDGRVQSLLTTVWTEAGRMFLYSTIEKYRNQLGIKK